MAVTLAYSVNFIKIEQRKVNKIAGYLIRLKNKKKSQNSHESIMLLLVLNMTTQQLSWNLEGCSRRQLVFLVTFKPGQHNNNSFSWIVHEKSLRKEPLVFVMKLTMLSN